MPNIKLLHNIRLLCYLISISCIAILYSIFQVPPSPDAHLRPPARYESEAKLCIGTHCHHYLLTKDEIQKATVLQDLYALDFDLAVDILRASKSAESHTGLDYTLILAVGAVESRFNPNAKSSAGAKGIMQIIPRYHKETLRSTARDEHESIWNPVSNVMAGAYILKEYAGVTVSSVCNALRKYNGSNHYSYSNKVLLEKKKLDLALNNSLEKSKYSCYNVG